MVKWIRVAACMVFLAAFLWGCSPGQADEQTAEEQQQAVAGLEGRDVQRVTQTASPEPEGTGDVGSVFTGEDRPVPVDGACKKSGHGKPSFQHIFIVAQIQGGFLAVL